MNNVLDSFQSALADRYVIQREVGRGGMANVYLAHDVRHDRAVAVKVLRPELGVLLGAERFLREIRVVARLNHPHILPVHDSGEVDGALFYVMPFVEGASLRERLRKEHRLPVTEAARIACEVAGALDLAHRRGVIHRDIKPGNILFVDGHAVVADFGIARAVHAAGGEMWETITDSGVALGTPAYMSPEQAVGSAALDARADIYSLGCVLYEMLVGEPPFIGPGGEVLIAKRFAEDAPPVSALRLDAPIELDHAVAKALARTPEERFASARDFMDTLAPVAATGQTAAFRPDRPVISRPVALAVASVMVAAATMFIWLAQRPADRSRMPNDTFASAVTEPQAPRPTVTPPIAPPVSRDSTAAVDTAAMSPNPAVVSTRQPNGPPADRTAPRPPVRTPAVGRDAPDAGRLSAAFQLVVDAARGVRQRAAQAGATPAELARGDSLFANALTVAARSEWAPATERVTSARSSWAEAQRAADARRAADSQIARAPVVEPPPAPSPRVAPPRETAAAEPPPAPPDPRVQIGAVLARYARALESRDLSELQSAYPGLTAAQRRSWEQFFQNVLDMRATLSITDLDVTGDVAHARVAGQYQYATGRDRRQERQPVAFHATFRRDGGNWRLAAVSQ